MVDYARALPRLPLPLSLSAIGSALELARPTATELLHSGLADKLVGEQVAYVTDNGPTIYPAGLEALLAVPELTIDDLGPAVNVRVRAARAVDDSDRKIMGWHAGLTAKETDLAVARWWPIPRIDPVGHAFVVSLAGFVVGAGRIQGYGIDRQKVSYDVDWQDQDIFRTWGGHRIPSPRGGSVIYL